MLDTWILCVHGVMMYWLVQGITVQCVAVQGVMVQGVTVQGITVQGDALNPLMPERDSHPS